MDFNVQVALNKRERGPHVVTQLSADKQSVEQAVMDLLKLAQSKTQHKLDICEQVHQQKKGSHVILPAQIQTTKKQLRVQDRF